MKKKGLTIIYTLVIFIMAGLITIGCKRSSPIEEKKGTQNTLANQARTIQPTAASQQPTDSETIAFEKIRNCIEPNFKRKKLPKGEKAYISRPASRIGLFQEGFVSSTERFLDSMNVYVRYISFLQVSPELAEKVSILIIPTEGLNPNFRSTADYERLKSYVSKGGNLLVFTQPTGKSYSDLMDRVEAVGYKEDKTCNFIEVSVVDRHPMFEGFPRKSFVMGFDGHFTKYPEIVGVYVKRDKLNQPVVIGYPLGKGMIIATTSFTPEDFDDRGYIAEDNIIFFREILNYFKLPMKLPTVKAGQDIEIKIKITNENSEKKATKASVMIYDPDRAFGRYYREFPIDLDPGASTFIEFEYHTCPAAPPGIWHLTYRLLYITEMVFTSELVPEGEKEIVEASLQSPREALDGRFIVIPK